MLPKIHQIFSPRTDQNGTCYFRSPGNRLGFGAIFDYWLADLCAKDVVGINLLGRDLQGVTLQKAKLMEAQLQNANLAGRIYARLMLVQISTMWILFRDADLTDARLNGANLSQAH